MDCVSLLGQEAALHCTGCVEKAFENGFPKMVVQQNQLCVRHKFKIDWFVVYKPILEAEIEETRKEVDNQKFSLSSLEKKLQKLNTNTFEAYQDMKYDLLNLDETLKGLSWLSEPTEDVDQNTDPAKKQKGTKKSGAKRSARSSR